MSRIQLLATGLDVAKEDVEAMAARGIDARPAMKAVLEVLRVAEVEQFESDGARGGHKWKDDSTAWQARKRAQDRSTEPERYTSALITSLTGQGTPEHSVRRANRKSAVFGTDLFYAHFYQWVRPLLAFTDRDRSRITDIFVSWVLNGTVPRA